MSIDTRFPRQPRLRALRDLAQRTSVLVRFRRDVVGLAVARGSSEAELLVELLRAPGAYRVLRRQNAVLVFRSGSRRTLERVFRCLRPAA